MGQRKPLGKEVVQTQEKPSAKLPKEFIGKDGVPMALIPSGEFEMGSSEEKAVHTVQRTPMG